jgi:hypothetical protein
MIVAVPPGWNWERKSSGERETTEEELLQVHHNAV